MANYKVEDIEGIGEVRGEKLRAVGIKDTDSLLLACSTRKQREDVAAKADVSPTRLLKWANMADLYRINGVGSEFAELLEASGVDTVPDLARRNSAKLAETMQQVNIEKKLTRRVPTEAEIAKWIDEAKQLPRVLEY